MEQKEKQEAWQDRLSPCLFSGLPSCHGVNSFSPPLSPLTVRFLPTGGPETMGPLSGSGPFQVLVVLTKGPDKKPVKVLHILK